MCAHAARSGRSGIAFWKNSICSSPAPPVFSLPTAQRTRKRRCWANTTLKCRRGYLGYVDERIAELEAAGVLHHAPDERRARNLI